MRIRLLVVFFGSVILAVMVAGFIARTVDGIQARVAIGQQSTVEQPQ